MQMPNWAFQWSERGLLPDTAIRAGIKRLLQRRLVEISAQDCSTAAEIESAFLAEMELSPIAPVPHLANQQHYEVPAEFFHHVLGQHKKYSACFWTSETINLKEAEANALAITCDRAELCNGQHVLELGCGWGSLSLWMAEHYPASQIVAVSNSHAQRAYIMEVASQRNLKNLRVLTCDMNEFAPIDFGISPSFDRIVSVEMFEHMRNYRRLFSRIHHWLVPGGRFFMHIFVHRTTPYTFEVKDQDDWMSKHFFSGGIMPSDALPLHFQDKLKFLRRWRWDGTHYEKTANAWLENMDLQEEKISPILEYAYGAHNAEIWRMRWRIFFMSCAELFGMCNGQEWFISHYLFERPIA